MLTADELEALLTAARGPAPRAFPLVLFLADTGCRIGEAVALRWADLDLERGLAQIERSIDHLGRLGPTKTRRGRVVELSTRLAESLTARRPDLFGEAALVFPNAEGKSLDSRNFAQRDFARVARLAFGRARRVTPHDLRHTWVSRHLAAGTPIKWIRERGGWTTAKVLLDVYGHFMPSDFRGFADAIAPRPKHELPAGSSSGERNFDIVPGAASGSIVSFRVHSSDPRAQMPPIARSVSHNEAVAILDDWIDNVVDERYEAGCQ